MKTIWKFPVPADDEAEIEMPRGAHILSVQTQHGAPYIWALVDPEVERETRTFLVLGTGSAIPDEPLRHLGTFQLNGGNLVFHLFELDMPQVIS